MLILLLLLFIGVEVNADFTIESINLLSGIHFETDDEEDNNK